MVSGVEERGGEVTELEVFPPLFLPRDCKMGLLQEELARMEMSCLQGEGWGGSKNPTVPLCHPVVTP